MAYLTPDEESAIRQELQPGEQILWTGRPNRSVIFHTSDWFVVPFSLFWAGMTINIPWNPHELLTGVLLPAFFVAMGQWITWGRFVYAFWKKGRVLYVLTNERAMTMSSKPLTQMVATPLRTMQASGKQVRRKGIGTLTFGAPGQSGWGNFGGRRGQMDELQLNAGVPVFVDVDDAEDVYALAMRQHLRPEQQRAVR